MIAIPVTLRCEAGLYGLCTGGDQPVGTSVQGVLRAAVEGWTGSVGGGVSGLLIYNIESLFSKNHLLTLFEVVFSY